MARRRQHEIAFGSDAFLDIVANIVGILIILIVVAGVKVGRAPMPPSTAPAESAVASPQIPVAATPVREMSEELSSAAPRTLNEAEVQPPPELPPMEPESSEWLQRDGKLSIAETLPETLPETLSRRWTVPVRWGAGPRTAAAAPPEDLVQEAERLEQELGEIDQAIRQTVQQRDQWSQWKSEQSRQLAQLTSMAAQLSSGTEQRQLQLKQLRDKQIAEQARLSQLEELLEARRKVIPPAETIEHRLNPIGQMVSGDEIHYRLEGNRVSHVPVSELSLLVKADLERRKDILLTRSFYKGNVGPRQGYRLEYLVQREGNSVAEDLRFGRGMIRINVAQWVIVPEPGLITESAAEALRPESRFVEALRQAKGSTAITLWVYPDSFTLHRQLKEAIQTTGFSVASRPLPSGVPITGSPDGSKSVSQ